MARTEMAIASSTRLNPLFRHLAGEGTPMVLRWRLTIN
jgi:hypothetical protein